MAGVMSTSSVATSTPWRNPAQFPITTQATFWLSSTARIARQRSSRPDDSLRLQTITARRVCFDDKSVACQTSQLTIA